MISGDLRVSETSENFEESEDFEDPEVFRIRCPVTCPPPPGAGKSSKSHHFEDLRGFPAFPRILRIPRILRFS